MRQSRGFFFRLGSALSSAAVRTLLAVVIVMSIALVVRTGSDSGRAPLTLVLLVLVVAVTVAGVVGIMLTLAGYDADAPDIADRLADDPDQRRLLARWLQRARWARFVGGFAGCIVWAVGTQTQGDVLVCGALGIFVGATIAELHHLRRPAGPRVARLEVRTVADYLDPADERRMIAVASLAAVAAAVGAVVEGARPAISWGLAAVVLLALVHLAQRRVASRGRPAVSDSLRRADDLARSLAIGRGLALPGTYAALALLARACFALEPAGSALPVLGFGAWLYGARLWWRNRRLGLDSVLHRPLEVAHA